MDVVTYDVYVVVISHTFLCGLFCDTSHKLDIHIVCLCAWCVVRGAWCVVRGAWCVVRVCKCAVTAANKIELPLIIVTHKTNYCTLNRNVIIEVITLTATVLSP